MKIAIYTAIFGGYDTLIESQLNMEGVDYLCFTDMGIQSNTWKIINSVPLYTDPNRCAKKYKILPHRYLQEYDYSIWIDGNFKVIGDVRNLTGRSNFMVFDHNQTALDPRNCIYEEYNAIIELGQNSKKGYKDVPQVMYNQVSRYLKEGYPSQNGLTTNGVIIRHHTNGEVVKTMEDWWEEIKHNSKRDQLSFNYIAWKNKFNFHYMDGDIRSNKYFKLSGKHKK